jgi:hypothetical protein
MAFETCTVHGAWFSMCDCGVAQNCRIKLLVPCYMRTFAHTFKIHFGRVKIIIYGVFGNEYIGSSFGRFCGL